MKNIIDRPASRDSNLTDFIALLLRHILSLLLSKERGDKGEVFLLIQVC
jgi:hypothetical protein